MCWINYLYVVYEYYFFIGILYYCVYEYIYFICTCDVSGMSMVYMLCISVVVLCLLVLGSKTKINYLSERRAYYSRSFTV